MSSERKRLGYICVAIIFGFLLTFPLEYLLQSIFSSAFEGESFGYLNTLIERNKLKDPLNRDLNYYLELANGLLFRVRLLYLFLSAAVLFIYSQRKTVSQFFKQPSGPLNLAVFRIVVFANALFFSIELIRESSQLPVSALVPPLGWANALKVIPFSPQFNEVLMWIFKAASFLALVGWMTRASVTVATLTGLYVMGIPQFFGKVDHYHHIWLSMVILSFAPCGDALSIDRLLAKVKSPPARALRYSVPLRWVWLMIGVIYFFPGVWKLLLGGAEWIFSDNLKWKFYGVWFERGYVPPFPVDEYPSLMVGGALFTILIEVLFIFLVLLPKTRWLAVLGGLGFHFSTLMFMNIKFFHLMSLYVAFIDWEKILNKSSSQVEDPTADSWIRKEHFVGATLCSLLFFAGVALVDSWPFSVYPPFASIDTPKVSALVMKPYSGEKPGSEVFPLHDPDFVRHFYDHARLRSFINRVLIEKDPQVRDLYAQSLWQIAKEKQPEVAVDKVEFYRTVHSTLPEDKGKPPLSEELVFTLEVQ